MSGGLMSGGLLSGGLKSAHRITKACRCQPNVPDADRHTLAVGKVKWMAIGVP